MDKYRGKTNKVVYAPTKNADQPVNLLSMNRVLDVCTEKNIDHQLSSEHTAKLQSDWVGAHPYFIHRWGHFLVKLLVKCKTLDSVLYQCTHSKLFLAQNQVVVVFFKSVNID